MITITPDQIDQAAESMCRFYPWGFMEYVKDDKGNWKLESLLIEYPADLKSYRVFVDNRPTELIDWALVRR